MANGITGRGPMRDQLILCNALAYAILTIERLPKQQQEYSNKEDMKRMLEHFGGSFLGVEHWMEVARRHMDGVGFREPKAIDKRCIHCGQPIWPGEYGSWIDASDGDGCGETVHQPKEGA